MKFKDLRTIQTLLKEYGMTPGAPTSSGNQRTGSIVNKVSSSPTINGTTQKEKPKTVSANTVKVNAKITSPDGKKSGKVVSPVNKNPAFGGVVVQSDDGEYFIIKGKDRVQIQPEEVTEDLKDYASTPEIHNRALQIAKDAYKKSNKQVSFTKLYDKALEKIDPMYGNIKEGKLGKLARKNNRKLKIKDLKGKIKKLSRKRLKEADPKLFEINFNKKEIATQGLDAPVKCGFEAETFFYSVDSSSGSNVDDMSISDIEYEYGDMPDQVWEDFEDWLYNKGQDEYLDDIINDKVEEVREDEEYLNDFIDSGSGPSSEAIERYKKDFEEDDPVEFQNREEDGWEYMNWVREYVEEEYEEEYLDWLKKDVAEDNDLGDDARQAARDDYSVEDWIYDNYSYMSSFLDDYGYDYSSGEGGVSDVADELHNWIKDNSKFDSYPESGDYGDTNTTTAWSVEKDSSIEPDEGTGAELISPVFDSTRKMLEEMRSLFDWSEENFGTNTSTGLHVTMSWQGKNPDLVTTKDEDDEFFGTSSTGPNKLKMALLLGDEYLLAEFGRLRNSFTKSQYRNVLRYAEGMKRGDAKSFKQFEEMLSRGIDSGKMNSIHFKGQTDTDSGNNLIEFRIAGGTDYNTMYEKVVKACVRYATIMKAGYDENAFRKDYVNAVFRLLRKSQEIDPKKLKDLEVVNHEVIDSAKSIVGKKDYFDVIKLLSTSVEYLQGYKELSDPDADKQWKQEIKDYEKGTGDKVEIEEETIRGYLKPNSMAPSKRAAGELDKAQDRFGSAITLLARDIADGNNRAPVSAKHIGAFRKFAKELQLNTDAIEKLALSGMNNYNFDGTDKEKIARIQKGINTLFKQDIVKQPEYLAIKDVDVIGSKMWQFYQSEDAKDNVIMDQLAELLVNLNPSNNKIDVDEVLRELSHERSENGFYAKLKGRGWNTRIALLKNNGITTKGSAQELLKFLEPYSGYKHPTSPDHHVNIKSDDKYSEVFQMRLTQRLRDRLAHLKDLETQDKEKYMTIAKQISKLGIELLEGLKPRPDLWDEDEDGYRQINRGNDGPADLASHDSLERWNDVMDRLVKMDDEIGKDDSTYNFDRAFDDYVLSSINVGRHFSWKENDGPTQSAVRKQLHKERFAAIKKFLLEFDKIFRKEGFANLKQEIQAKNTLDRRNRDFEKNVRDNAKAKLNIPSHSWVYIDKEFFDTITDKDYDDRAAYLDNHIEHFNDKVNQSKVYVIPSSHFTDAEDATNGLELIDTFEKNKNYYHTWRKKGYKKIVNRFNRIYGYSWKDIIDPDKFIQGDGDVYQKLQGLGIEVTHKGDSRKGAPGQEDLFPDEETQNPKSGEPLNRSSGMSWENIEDDAEQKRFDAFDWDQYPAKMKDVVAKEMANKESSAGSFKVALDNILKKVLDGDVGIDQSDLGKPIDKLAIAAGIDPDDGGSSNGIASKTDWGNLADHLGIERGVNDQGVELLRVVYNRTDGDHNWRPEETDENGNNVIGLRRWGAAVREAEKYIRDNYNVSGGNYFRKDADGGNGDDVSDIYGTPEQETDYDVAREDYPIFDMLMSNGMQKFLARGEVNNLVAFLNNNSNDREFKRAVLDTLSSAPESGMGAFDDFESVLASARMNMSRQNQESVFARFDKLPLQEQLRIVSDSKVLEGFYKDQLIKKQDDLKFNKVGPRTKTEYVPRFNTKPKSTTNFAQPYFPHPQEIASWGHDETTLMKLGFKRASNNNFYIGMSKWNKLKDIDPKKWKILLQSKVNEAIGPKVSEGPISESLPDNSIPGLINQLLAEPMPAWDLKKQFLAYYAVPDPAMLTAFRNQRAEAGNNACLRSILRHFAKMQLHPTLLKKINLNEGALKEYDDLSAEKDKIIDVIKSLDIENDNDRAIVDQIWRILNSDHIQELIGTVIAKPIADETAMNKVEATKVLTKVIYQVESDYGKIKEFLDLLETTGSAYDVDSLFTPLGNVRSAFASDVAYTVFKTLIPYGSGSNKKGPGEFALAMLSDRVRLSDTKGDLVIDDNLVELKLSKSEGQSGGGRLGMNGISQQDALTYIEQFRDDIPNVMAHVDNPSNKSLGFTRFIDLLNLDLPIGDKRRYDIALGFYSKFFSTKAANIIAKSIMNDANKSTIELNYYKANYMDYKVKGQFDALLSIDIYTGKTAYFKTVQELLALKKSGHLGTPSLSFIPTNAGSPEVFVQMAYTKFKG